MTLRIIDDETARKLRLLYESGKTVREVSEELGVTRMAAQSALLRAGTTMRSMNYKVRRVSAETIRGLREEGKTWKEVALLTGISTNTAMKYMDAPEAGVVFPQSDVFSPSALKAARVSAGLSQTELARRIGCPKPDLIRQWENGERRPQSDYLLRILVVLACQPRDLMERGK